MFISLLCALHRVCMFHFDVIFLGSLEIFDHLMSLTGVGGTHKDTFLWKKSHMIHEMFFFRLVSCCKHQSFYGARESSG